MDDFTRLRFKISSVAELLAEAGIGFGNERLVGPPGGGKLGQMSITLHDLAGADPDLRFSPYC